MLQFHADKFVALASVLRTVSMYLLRDPQTFNDPSKSDAERAMLAGELSKSIVLLEGIGLRQSVKKAKKINGQLNFAGYNATHFSVSIDELMERIKDELEDGVFLHLSEAEARLYEPASPLCGQEVADNFPSSSYDIVETGKCLALGRSTAAVMHSMRALEPGLVAMAKEVGYTPQRDTWNEAIDAISNRLDPKHANYVQDKDKREFLSPAAAQFRFFKDAWRNHAMHSREKYTPEEAMSVATSVQSFMKHLAKRLKE